MLTNREMLSNMRLFSIFLCTFAIKRVTLGARKLHIECMFCYIYSKQCLKIISSRVKCGLFSSEFKNYFPNKTTLTFQEVDGVTEPFFVNDARTSHGMA